MMAQAVYAFKYINKNSLVSDELYVFKQNLFNKVCISQILADYKWTKASVRMRVTVDFDPLK